MTKQRFSDFVCGAVNMATNLMVHSDKTLTERFLAGGFSEQDRIFCSCCVCLCLKVGEKEGFTQQETYKAILDAAESWKAEEGIYTEFYEIIKLWKKDYHAQD